LLGVVFLIYFRKMMVAWRDWRSAVFGLEKENAQRKFSASLTVVGLLGMMLLTEFVLISFIAPAFPKTFLLATPTLNLLATPTATLSILGAEAGIVVQTESTPMPEGTNGCIPGQIEWTVPRDGATLQGVIELQGTVNLPTLGFYKFEYSAVGSNSWMPIAAGSDKKENEPLGGNWNTGQLVPGDYLIRLVVTDNLNAELAPCVITVQVIAEE
jgi:hypothetical protein